MSLIIGLTGSIASGKSTVASMLMDLDIPVLDADKIAREVVEPGEESYDKIIDAFGKEILLDDQSLDRKKLGSIIFADDQKRIQLNEIIHPAIRRRMDQQKKETITLGKKCVVLDIPLLFEGKRMNEFDKVLVVYIDEKEQLRRLIERNHMTEEEARQRIDSQISIEEKKKLADGVINNNGTRDESFQQLKLVLKKWDCL